MIDPQAWVKPEMKYQFLFCLNEKKHLWLAMDEDFSFDIIHVHPEKEDWDWVWYYTRNEQACHISTCAVCDEKVRKHEGLRIHLSREDIRQAKRWIKSVGKFMP